MLLTYYINHHGVSLKYEINEQKRKQALLAFKIR